MRPLRTIKCSLPRHVDLGWNTGEAAGEVRPHHVTSTVTQSTMLYVRSLPTIAAVLALATAATAQVGTVYTFAQSVGTYTPITGGTQLAVCTGTSGAASIDDVTYPSVALPFSFIFEGAPYSAVNVNSNGFLTFGGAVPTAATYAAISSTTAYNGAVAAFSRDIQAGFCFTGDI